MNELLSIKTENFDGPLDLFLYLIENKNIDISNIVLSTIIDEYLDIINNEKKHNLKIKVEFLSMASELLEIKAYSVLSLEKKKEKEKKIGDKIIEYKLIKQIANEFSNMELEYNRPYSINGIKTKNRDNIFYTIDELKFDLIKNIYKDIINKKLNNRNIKIDINENYTSDDAIFEIQSNLKKRNKFKFSKLLELNISKTKIVTLFLVILDLYKNGQINIDIIDNDFIIRKDDNV